MSLETHINKSLLSLADGEKAFLWGVDKRSPAQKITESQ
jgi:hypothetical protein